MTFQQPQDLEDKLLAVKCLILGYEAIDIERGLILKTANERTRLFRERRWFVYPVKLPSYRLDLTRGRVEFRAFSGVESALHRLSSPETANRINDLVAKKTGQT